jgi:1-aminocyclopropane-1-carboxylate deaminase
MIINSPTLQFARKKGMLLHFVSRNEYDGKNEKSFREELKKQFGNIYIIPEGGNNSEGVKGCAEILTNIPFYDYVFCACGTACTFTGIYSSLKQNQIAVGVSVLKGENELINDLNKYADEFQFKKLKETINYPISTSCILNNFHFGGYAKHTQELIDFKRSFETNYKIPLDYVYTAKLFYAVYSLIDNSKLLPNKKLLIIHSGGQQGNQAYEQRYKINM